MKEIVEIVWTAANLDEARKICRYLVQERLVASAKIIPWVEAISNLDNQLETTQESKIELLTVFDHYEKIVNVICQNSTFQVPEIIYRSIKGGSQPYLDWIYESADMCFKNN